MQLLKVSSLLIPLVVFSVLTADNSKVGTVLILKGEVVEQKSDGTETYLQKGDPVFEKSKIKTMDNSFIRIIFDDRSSVNIGPESLMEIRHYPKNKPGVLSLVRGKIRTFVKKDYLKWRREKNKSKLFIKTENAAMGVRGTDFIVDYDTNTKITNLDVITGQVAMINSKGLEKSKVDPAYLDTILKSKKAVFVNPGMRTSVLDGNKTPLRPRLIPKKTLNNLQKNPNLIIKRNVDPKAEVKTRVESRDNKAIDYKIRPSAIDHFKKKNPIDPRKSALQKNNLNNNRPEIIKKNQIPQIKRPILPKRPAQNILPTYPDKKPNTSIKQ